ncbi:mitochondrial inner-membrane-bound regulator-domain-containing protein [Xylariaceae sp. FL1272]|nr:mitochondrial inner-membrane-bound regulator-domain-containing protein [Xylariaceae sp. FL1272]
MLARTPSVGAVCLRCRVQQRLVRQSAAFRYASDDASSGATPHNDAGKEHRAALKETTSRFEDLLKPDTTSDDTPGDLGFGRAAPAPAADAPEAEPEQRSPFAKFEEEIANVNRPNKQGRKFKTFTDSARSDMTGSIANSTTTDPTSSPFGVRRVVSEPRESVAYKALLESNELVEATPTRMKHMKLHRHYKSGNRRYREDSTSLGAVMLGKPAAAIIMRDHGAIKRKRHADLKQRRGQSDDTPRASASDLEKLIDSEGGKATAQEILSSIHQLQPADKILRDKDFRKLQKVLSEGFLSAQLLQYIEWQKSKPTHVPIEPNAKQERALLEKQYAWIYTIKPWVKTETEEPGQRPTDGHQPPAYTSETTTPKEYIAIHIMREIWGVSLAELGPPLGETRVTLQGTEFALLMRGTQRFMHSIGKELLDSGEKIEALRSKNTLRFVTAQGKVKQLLETLDRILESMTTSVFRVPIAKSVYFDDATLEEVGRITNSQVKFTKNRAGTQRQLHVTWLELKSRAQRDLKPLENIGHIVYRLLLSAASQKHISQMFVQPGAMKTVRLIKDSSNKDNLAWRDKLRRWARYVSPTAQQTAVDEKLPIQDLKLPFDPLGASTLSTQPDDTAENNTTDPHIWPKSPRTVTTAHFGYVLHPYPAVNSKELDLENQDHRFSHIAPHPNALISLNKATDSIVETSSTIILHFSPPLSSATGSSPSPTPPTLELHLSVSDTRILGARALHAIKQNHHTTILLPSSPVDLRLTQTEYTPLNIRPPYTLMSYGPIQDYLKNAVVDLRKGKLDFPAEALFRIPQHLFTLTPDPKGPDSDSQILYDYMGLEFRRSAKIPYSGHELTYTSIEAGQGGGRRAEVTLTPLPQSQLQAVETEKVCQTLSDTSPEANSGAGPEPEPQSGEKLTNQKQLQSFLKVCSEFANNHALWFGTDRQEKDNPEA